MDGFLNLAANFGLTLLAFSPLCSFSTVTRRSAQLRLLPGAIVSLLLSWPIAFAAFFAEHFGEHPVEGQLF